MRPIKYKSIIVLFLSGMLLIHILMWWRLRPLVAAGYPDFTSFYAGGKIVARGLGRRLYEESLEWRVQQEFASGVTTRKASLPYVHAPFEVLLFVPLSLFGYWQAYSLWNFINLVILICLSLLLKPHLPRLRQYTTGQWLFLALAFLPIAFTMIQGQDAILLLLIFSLSYCALKEGAEFRAGCWLALGLFRFHFVVPFIAILCLARKWKLVCGFCCGAIPLTAISVLVVGWRTAVNYPLYIWNLEQHTGRGILLPRDTPSLRGLLEDLFYERLGSHQTLGIIVVASLAIIGLAARSWHRAENSDPRTDLAFCVSLLAAELASYHTFIYDFSVLLLAIVIIMNYISAHPPSTKIAKIELTLPILALFVTPLYLVVWLRWQRSDLMGLVLLGLGWAMLKEISRMPSYVGKSPSVTQAAM